nr:translation initiation factor IF-2-like [Equus asinus]
MPRPIPAPDGCGRVEARRGSELRAPPMSPAHPTVRQGARERRAGPFRSSSLRRQRGVPRAPHPLCNASRAIGPPPSPFPRSPRRAPRLPRSPPWISGAPSPTAGSVLHLVYPAVSAEPRSRSVPVWRPRIRPRPWPSGAAPFGLGAAPQGVPARRCSYPGTLRAWWGLRSRRGRRRDGRVPKSGSALPARGRPAAAVSSRPPAPALCSSNNLARFLARRSRCCSHPPAHGACRPCEGDPRRPRSTAPPQAIPARGLRAGRPGRQLRASEARGGRGRAPRAPREVFGVGPAGLAPPEPRGAPGQCGGVPARRVRSCDTPHPRRPRASGAARRGDRLGEGPPGCRNRPAGEGKASTLPEH